MNSPAERENNMKTILTLAVAVFLSATVAHAEVIAKGGATGLFKGTVVRAEKPAPAAMSCANCKSEFATLKVPAFKGTAPAQATVERHACAACGTKWVATGHGKAKAEKAIHTCAGCKS
jgi:hypothetical protein